jgi:thioredoxin reductase (NADPH)
MRRCRPETVLCWVCSKEETVRAQAVVITTGAQYRWLDADNLAEFEGISVHYWASPLERRLCAGSEIALVGAGNSAGQAAVYLAGQVEKVWMIVRGASLETTMSHYLSRTDRRTFECRSCARHRNCRSRR